MALVGCADSTTPGASEDSGADAGPMRNECGPETAARLILNQEDPFYCAMVGDGGDPAAAVECVQQRMAQDEPFVVEFSIPGIDSVLHRGFVGSGNTDNTIHEFFYDSAGTSYVGIPSLFVNSWWLCEELVMAADCQTFESCFMCAHEPRGTICGCTAEGGGDSAECHSDINPPQTDE